MEIKYRVIYTDEFLEKRIQFMRMLDLWRNTKVYFTHIFIVNTRAKLTRKYIQQIADSIKKAIEESNGECLAIECIDTIRLI